MRGILFCPEMIQAIKEGRKKQTRRVIRPQPTTDWQGNQWLHYNNPKKRLQLNGYTIPLLAYYKIGETVYVKEAWTPTACFTGIKRALVEYKLDGQREEKECTETEYFKALNFDREWNTPLFMPEWAARYFHTITDVKAQRVQEISWQEIIAEGVDSGQDIHFQELWNSINAKPKPVKVKGVVTHYESYPWEEGYREETYRGLPHYIYGNPWEFTYTIKETNI